LGCSISYQFFNDVESKLAEFLQSLGTIKRAIFRKVRKGTILKLYNTLILPTFLYGSENWTPTASQRRRIEAAEMKLWQATPFMTTKQTTPYAENYRLHAYLTRLDEYRLNGLLHLQRMPQNQIPLKSYHDRPQGREQLENRIYVGGSSCNSGD
jgi:hypothetical protein